MYSEPMCRYDVAVRDGRVRISLHDECASDGGRRRYRFAAEPTVETLTPADATATVDDRVVTVEPPDSTDAIEATVTHDAVSLLTPAETIETFWLAFEDDAPVSDIAVRTTERIIAAESRSNAPYRRSRIENAVEYRGVGSVDLAVTVTTTDTPSVMRREGTDRLLLTDGDTLSATDESFHENEAPCVPLESDVYADWFGRTVSAARLGGVTYLDRAVTQQSASGREYVHGERCLVRPPERPEDRPNRSQPGRYVVVDRDLARLLGFDVGSQVKIRPDVGRSALFTVAATVEQPGVTVRLTDEARRRLGTEQEVFGASITPLIADPMWSRDDARRNGGVVERLTDRGDDALIACAPHGGSVEINTDMQAHRLAARLGDRRATAWSCEGWSTDGDAFDRFHVRSSDVDPRSFPLLSSVADRGFDYAVSFHCHDTDGILVGGRAPERVRQAVGAAVADAVSDDSIEVRYEGQYMGRRSENFVNWLTADGDSGVQLEQSPYVVKYRWREVVDAVAIAFESL